MRELLPSWVIKLTDGVGVSSGLPQTRSTTEQLRLNVKLGSGWVGFRNLAVARLQLPL